MSQARRAVVVVGSANLDEVVAVPRHPGAGETILGGDLIRSPGGKGANQAVASARAGDHPTVFIGAVGEDEGARVLLDSLQRAGVDTSLVSRVPGASGTALITVSPDGENAIVVAPGANRQVRIGAAEAAALRGAGAVLAQLEIPIETILAAADACRDEAPLLLNAAPSAALPDALWRRVDVLIVNEHEAADLTGGDPHDAEALATELLRRVPAAVVTLGSRGCLVAERGESAPRITALAGHAVNAIDTTGAGDTFCGVLAARVASGADLVSAAGAGSAAAALAVTRPGAQEAVPTAAEVERMLASGAGATHDSGGVVGGLPTPESRRG